MNGGIHAHGDGAEAVSARLTVAIVEDHAMVAQGLAAAISVEPDLEVVGTAGTLEKGLALVHRHRPDVVLMDYRLPDGDGVTGAAAVKDASPRTQVVMLTAVGGRDVLTRAIETGCAGFLHKTEPIGELRAAVRRAGRGEAIFAPEVLADVVGRLRHGRPPAGPELTPREVEVLSLLVRGASTEEVAGQLFLSLHTVRNHVRNILAKLGVHSKVQAVALALRDGIVPLDAPS